MDLAAENTELELAEPQSFMLSRSIEKELAKEIHEKLEKAIGPDGVKQGSYKVTLKHSKMDIDVEFAKVNPEG